MVFERCFRGGDAVGVVGLSGVHGCCFGGVFVVDVGFV